MNQNKNPATPEALAGRPAAPAEEWVRLAHVVRPQGRKGELLAELLTDFPEKFAERRRLFLRAAPGAVPGSMSGNTAGSEPREVALEQHWLHKDRLVLKFQGIDSIEAVEALRGYDVVIPRAERAPLDQDSVYIGDLAGCLLYDRATASVVGEIVDVDRESSSTALIVVRPGRGNSGITGELLIPFAKAYLPSIDLGARRMEMTLPEGLLSLNAPLTAEERAVMTATLAGSPDAPGTTQAAGTMQAAGAGQVESRSASSPTALPNLEPAVSGKTSPAASTKRKNS